MSVIKTEETNKGEESWNLGLGVFLSTDILISEFQDKKSISRLVHNETGSLTSWLHDTVAIPFHFPQRLTRQLQGEEMELWGQDQWEM